MRFVPLCSPCVFPSLILLYPFPSWLRLASSAPYLLWQLFFFHLPPWRVQDIYTHSVLAFLFKTFYSTLATLLTLTLPPPHTTSSSHTSPPPSFILPTPFTQQLNSLPTLPTVQHTPPPSHRLDPPCIWYVSPYLGKSLARNQFARNTRAGGLLKKS